MSEGRIVEQGTHIGLLEKRSVYYDLIEKQRIYAQKQNEIITAEEPVPSDLEKHPIITDQVEKEKENQSDESASPTEWKQRKNSTWTLVRFVAGLNRGETIPMLGGLLFSIIAGAAHPT